MQRFLADRRPTASSGWAAKSLDQSMRRTVLAGGVLWQVLMVVVVVGHGQLEWPWVLLGIGHGVVGVAGVAARREQLPAGVVLTAAWLLFLADWTVADSIDGPLLLAACWMANITAASVSFAMRGRAAIALPCAAAVLLPIVMIVIRPEWAAVLPSSVLVTTLSILVATRIGLSYLWDFAARADAQGAAAESQERALIALRVTSQEAAEDARVLHDTVVNTLAAIASGSRALRNTDAVRERCARDVETVTALDAGRGVAPALAFGEGRSLDAMGINLVRTGLTGSDLDRELADLPADVNRALTRAVDELLQNAAKHSGASDVTLEVHADPERLVITVADDGVGFDPQGLPDRGLARSVLARAHAVGVEVDLRSTPGSGTTVVLVHHRGRGDRDRTALQWTDGFRALVSGIRTRAAWLYAVGLACIGLVLAVVNHPGQWTPEYLMVAVLALTYVGVWLLTRERRTVGMTAAALLALGSMSAFVFSVWAIDFGRTNVVVWQAIGATGPVILLRALARSEAAFRVGCAMLALAVLSVALAVAPDSIEAAAVVVIGGCAALGLPLGWGSFHHAIGSVAAQSLRDHRVLVAASADAAKVEAASAARGRWRSAGLQDALGLLQGISDGRLDPEDPVVQARCGEEESYLRQLIQLNPAQVRMGSWYLHALREARARGVRLVLRSGDAEPAADGTAEQLGRDILRAVSAVDSGEDLTVTLYPSGSGLRLTMVAPHPRLTREAVEWRPPVDAEASFKSLGTQDMVEFVLPAEGATVRRAA